MSKLTKEELLKKFATEVVDLLKGKSDEYIAGFIAGGEYVKDKFLERIEEDETI